MTITYVILLTILQFTKGQEDEITIGTRVSGGFTPVPGKVPYEVSLTGDKPDGSVVHCSGGLLSARTVLTAAHCIDRATRVQVRVVRKDGVQEYVSEELIPHPQYNERVYQNDIGLVKLGEAVPLGGLVQPLALPLGPQLARTYFMNKYLRATGWGYTDRNLSETKVVQSLMVRLVSESRCRAFVSSMIGREENFSRLCSFFYNTRKGLCQGDSGGPLVMDPDTVVGVTSLLYSSEGNCSCGCRGFVNIFTSVIPYLSWIKQNL